MNIRNALPEDCPQLAHLEAEVTQLPWSAAQYAGSLSAGHRFWVCEEEGGIVAWAVTLSVLDEAELLNIATAAPRQGRGLARALLDALCAGLAAQGCTLLRLEVRESNTRARRLYTSGGFAESGVRKHYYRSANGREHAILMEKAL